MKRLMAFFLLLALPLQYSWATLGGYCQHEAAIGAQQHFGHHVHKHQQADKNQPLPGPSTLHADCLLCHLGFTGFPMCPLVAGQLALTALIAPAPPYTLTEIYSEPEKPNWAAAD